MDCTRTIHPSCGLHTRYTRVLFLNSSGELHTRYTRVLQGLPVLIQALADARMLPPTVRTPGRAFSTTLCYVMVRQRQLPKRGCRSSKLCHRLSKRRFRVSKVVKKGLQHCPLLHAVLQPCPPTSMWMTIRCGLHCCNPVIMPGAKAFPGPSCMGFRA